MLNSLRKYKIINAVSMGASITSAAFIAQYLNDIAIQLVFTGTPTGTFTIEGSVDHEEDAYGNVIIPGTWTALSLDSMPASGAAGDILINLNGIAFTFLRIKYTRSSGTGTLNAYVAGKSQG